MKFLLMIPIVFLFSGCCFSIINDTCVIERKVPVTKIVYKKCTYSDVPKPPQNRHKVDFKKIEFDDKLFYGLTKEDSINLYMNITDYKDYCNKLENIIKN